MVVAQRSFRATMSPTDTVKPHVKPGRQSMKPTDKKTKGKLKAFFFIIAFFYFSVHRSVMDLPVQTSNQVILPIVISCTALLWLLMVLSSLPSFSLSLSAEVCVEGPAGGGHLLPAALQHRLPAGAQQEVRGHRGCRAGLQEPGHRRTGTHRRVQVLNCGAAMAQ